MEELQNNGVHIYQFPSDDEAVADLNRKMNEQVPFAVVGSREELVVNGHKVRARMYPWGTVEGKSMSPAQPTFVENFEKRNRLQIGLQLLHHDQ